MAAFSSGLPGVGLPRKVIKGDTGYTLITQEGTKEGISLGWEDVRYLKQGTITCRVTDDALSGGPVERQMLYYVPATAATEKKTIGSLGLREMKVTQE